MNNKQQRQCKDSARGSVDKENSERESSASGREQASTRRFCGFGGNI